MMIFHIRKFTKNTNCILYEIYINAATKKLTLLLFIKLTDTECNKFENDEQRSFMNTQQLIVFGFIRALTATDKITLDVIQLLTRFYCQQKMYFDSFTLNDKAMLLQTQIEELISNECCVSCVQ